MNNDFLFKIISGSLAMLKPVRIAANNQEERDALFAELGWDFYSISGFPVADVEQSLMVFKNASLALGSFLDTPISDFSSIPTLLLSVKNQFSTLSQIGHSLDNNSGISADVKSEFQKLEYELFDYLLARHFENISGVAYALLEITGIIQKSIVPIKYDTHSNVIRNAYQKTEIDFNRLKDLISNSFDGLTTDFYGSTNTVLPTVLDAENVASLLFPKLGLLFKALNFNWEFGIDPNFQSVFTTNEYASAKKMFWTALDDGAGNSLGFAINISSIAEGDLGFIIIPFGSFSFTQTFGTWDATIAANAVPGVVQYKNGKLILPSSFSSSYLDASVRFANHLNDEEQPVVDLSITDNFTFLINQLSAKIGVKLENLTDTEFAFEFGIDKASLNLTKSEADNFINSILPDDGVSLEFNFTIGFSNKRGLYFSGNCGLEALLPIHKTIGILEVDDLFLSAKTLNGGSIALEASTSIKAEIGSLNLNIQRLGVRNLITFPAQRDGNFGSLDTSLRFKPPTGIAISVISDSVTGGGFLNFDTDQSTYTGALGLKFSKFALSAIGILTTRMPDQSDGYSLLIIITATFNALPIGMGFTLNGVGGLLGLNRTMNPERLRTGIRDGTVDSILFPDPALIVKNADTIISKVGQAFPAKKDRFLIGPMAKIGYGTGDLITIDLGIIIEVPSPIVLAIVGILRVQLPTKKSPALDLQVNFIGIIDFEKKQLSFDATLYNSCILKFGLEGDMALRLYWGDQPNFLLSVGGFHTKYTPPPMNLPNLKRLAIIFADEDDLSIKLMAFFAVTSNTVQFGAALDARARSGNLEAKGFVGFEVLVQFSPFYFIVSVEISLSLKWKSKNLAGVHIAMSLEGPHPWRVQGRGEVNFLGMTIGFSFDKTFGERKTETIETIKVGDILIAAIQDKNNWQAIAPARAHEVVSFREITGVGGSDILIDPFGALSLNQKAVPLNTVIAKYSTSAINDAKWFKLTITNKNSNTALNATAVRDFFAPESFFYLKAEEKLSRASYEKFQSGLTVGSPDTINSDYFIHRAVKYDEYTIDSRQRNRSQLPHQIDRNAQAAQLNASYISRSGISPNDIKPQVNGPNRLDVTQDSYLIANRNSLQTIDPNLLFASITQATDYLDVLNAAGTGSPDYIVVNTLEI